MTCRPTARIVGLTNSGRRIHKDKNMSAVTSGWLIGIFAATGTIVVMGFVSIGFYASFGGLLIVAGLAFMVELARRGSLIRA